MSKSDKTNTTLGTWDSAHSIRLSQALSGDDDQAIKQQLAELEGVISVDTTTNRQAIHVAYDQRLVGFEQIQGCLRELGFSPSDSAWSRLKARWFEYLDSNARANANLPEPPCCSNPRGISGKR